MCITTTGTVVLHDSSRRLYIHTKNKEQSTGTRVPGTSSGHRSEILSEFKLTPVYLPLYGVL